VAIKLISNKELEEINKLLLVGHQNIVTIVDIVKDSCFVGIVMPCAQMDLHSVMGNVCYSTAVTLQKLQTMAVVHHIHMSGICIWIAYEGHFASGYRAREYLHRPRFPGRRALHPTRLWVVCRGREVDAKPAGFFHCHEHHPEHPWLPFSGIQITRCPFLSKDCKVSSACNIYSAGVVLGEQPGSLWKDCYKRIVVARMTLHLPPYLESPNSDSSRSTCSTMTSSVVHCRVRCWFGSVTGRFSSRFYRLGLPAP
jgi:hypothetical protein